MEYLTFPFSSLIFIYFKTYLKRTKEPTYLLQVEWFGLNIDLLKFKRFQAEYLRQVHLNKLEQLRQKNFSDPFRLFIG